MKAAIYTRVSTSRQAEEGYSLTEQERRCRHHIDREDWTYIDTFKEEGVSGTKRSRPALDHLLASLPELDVVVISSLDRFGRSTKNLLELFDRFADAGVALVFLRERIDTTTPVGRLLRTVLAAIAEFERDLIAERTKVTLEARANAGKALGALPFGYCVADENRAADEDLLAVVVEIFERIVDGQTPGSVARWLNGQGIRTLRGTQFTQRSIRKIVANDAYMGQKGYPRIVSDELAQTARAAITRLDPAEIQRRKGGRRPKEPYMLRSIAFCAGCGAPLYRSYAYLGGRRAYVCSHKLQATGACNRPAILAEFLELHVLTHLGTFVGSIESWCAERLRERTRHVQARQRNLEGEKAQLAALDVQREKRMTELTEVGITSVGLEVVARLDREREAQAARVAEAEAVISEWTGDPDTDQIVHFYGELVDAVQGRIENADGVAELNEALGTILAGLWCEIDAKRNRLFVHFALQAPAEVKLPDGSPALFGSGGGWLPPATLGVEPLAETGPLRTLYGPVSEFVAIPPLAVQVGA